MNFGFGHFAAARPAMLNGRTWPRPGFPGRCRKLTLAGGTIAPRVGFLTPPRIHTGGQERAFATVGYPKSEQEQSCGHLRSFA